MEPTLRPSGRIVAEGCGAGGVVRLVSALLSSLALRPGRTWHCGPLTFPATPRALSPPPPAGIAGGGIASTTRRSSGAWNPDLGVKPRFPESHSSRHSRRDSKRSMSVSSCTIVSSLSVSRCSAVPPNSRQTVSSSAVSASSSVPTPDCILTTSTYHLCPTHPFAGL